jgi:hypothetical protein
MFLSKPIIIVITKPNHLQNCSHLEGHECLSQFRWKTTYINHIFILFFLFSIKHAPVHNFILQLINENHLISLIPSEGLFFLGGNMIFITSFGISLIGIGCLISFRNFLLNASRNSRGNNHNFRSGSLSCYFGLRFLYSPK